MIGLFLIKLILTFVIGSLFVTIITIISERSGTKLAGLIGGLPSTAVVALFFIGFTQSTYITAQATTLMPIIGGANALFVVVFILLARKKFYFALLGSLVTWFILSSIFLYLKPNLFWSLIGCLALLMISYYILEIKSNIKSFSKKRVKYTLSQLSFRALLSGALITFAVFIAKFGGPSIGGIFATFPAVFLSTAIITHITHGKEFSSAVMKVIMVSGVLNVTLYSILIRYMIVPLGLIYGTLACYLLTCVFAYFLYVFISKKMA